MANGKHVVPNPKGWAVRSAGASRAAKTFATQEAAIKYGTSAARKDGVELYVHRKDGTIRDRSSFGKDPHPPKG